MVTLYSELLRLPSTHWRRDSYCSVASTREGERVQNRGVAQSACFLPTQHQGKVVVRRSPCSVASTREEEK